MGIDFLETSRVEQELLRGEWLLDDGIFTPEEIHCCSSARRPARRYAACYAAKEATLKALGVRVTDLAMFREVEVEFRADNRQNIVLHRRLRAESENLGVQHIRLSIAHTAMQTSAIVILEDGTVTK